MCACVSEGGGGVHMCVCVDVWMCESGHQSQQSINNESVHVCVYVCVCVCMCACEGVCDRGVSDLVNLCECVCVCVFLSISVYVFVCHNVCRRKTYQPTCI